MKKAAALLLLILLLLNAAAQDSNVLPAAAPLSDSVQKKRSGSAYSLQTKKPQFNVTAGLEFSASSGFGSGFTQYVIPRVSYPLGKKFLVSGGLIIANTNYFNARPWYSAEGTAGYSGNYTSVTLFGSGSYFLNDRITISGAFYKEFPVSGQPLSYSPYYPINNGGSQGFNVNVEYRVGKNMFFRAGIQMDQGRNPYFGGPAYGYPGFGNRYGGCGMWDQGCGSGSPFGF